MTKSRLLKMLGPVACGLLLAFGLPLAGSAAPRQQLSGGHVPAAVARLQPIGRLPATNQLRLAIGLPLRDRAGLETFLAQLYDPASPIFRRYLTPEEFTARFGPTERDYQAVKDFAETNGLTITATHGNRLLLDAVGPAAAVEKAFRVTLHTYRHPTEARDFYAPDIEPSVDAALSVVDIQGLSDFWRPHPNLVRRDVANGQPQTGTGSAPDGSGSYFGDDFRHAYVVPGTTNTGAGQTVGLFEFDGYYTKDIAAYAAEAGNGRANIVIQPVPLDGYNGVQPGNGNLECSLDIEMAMAMAPGLSKIVVFEGINPNSVLNSMAASNTIYNLSSSWTWGGGPSTTTDAIFEQMVAQGQSYFQASGDSCAYTVGSNSVNGVDNPLLTNTPASSPYITQVGGTTLTTTTNGAYSSETVWNRRNGSGSSGGISSYYTIPTWQMNVSNMTSRGGSTMYRNTPDVALTAENILVIAGGNGTPEPGVGGTSAAAPLWAGFTALVNQRAADAKMGPVGFLNPALYTIGMNGDYANAFNDITNGDNTWLGSPNLFFAVPGYDLCTGWGTPGTNLINILTSPPPFPPSAPSIISQPQSQTVTAGASVTFSVYASGMGPLSYQWSFNGQAISARTDYTNYIARVQSIQAGTYTVLVSNSYGSVTSDSATLSISSASAFGIIGAPFRYRISANNNPTWYSASGLPPGLSCNGTTGVISGTPTATGTFSVYVQARNQYGTASATIPFTIANGAITSATSAQGVVGAPFNYQITADNSPTAYSASGLPSGLNYNVSSGVISGTPAQAGTFSVTVQARNIFASTSTNILLTIANGAITSATSAQGVVGAPFHYQIAANNSPTGYSASGLPSGLSYDAGSGLISGTPVQAGTFSVQVQARNVFGSASASILFTIANAAITSATSAQGVVGAPFYYQITANNSPTGYSASGLPSGLSYDAGSGLISGTPVQAGTFSVQVQARNVFGSASATIPFTIANGVITSATSAQGVVGAAFSYQITADNSPTGYSASGLPPGLSYDAGSGLISGTPVQAGTFSVYVQARNVFGSASATISVTISAGTIGASSLTILQTGDSVLLTWPVTSDGFVLEEAQMLSNTWTNSSAAVVVQGNANVAAIAPTGTAKFYRLRK